MRLHVPDLKIYLRDADYQIGVQYTNGNTKGLHTDSYRYAKAFLEQQAQDPTAVKIIIDAGVFGNGKRLELSRGKDQWQIDESDDLTADEWESDDGEE